MQQVQSKQTTCHMTSKVLYLVQTLVKRAIADRGFCIKQFPLVSNLPTAAFGFMYPLPSTVYTWENV
jgi:hypothetical protein